MIDVGAERIEGAPGGGDLRRSGQVRLAHADGAQAQRQTLGILRPGAAAGLVDRLLAVQLQVGGERDQRRMRVPVGEVPERRPGGVATLDRAYHRRRGPVGGVGMLRQVPGAAHVAVVAHAVVELPAGIAGISEEQLVVVGDPVLGAALFIQDHVVEADAVALGIDVQLAHRTGLVAGVAEGLRQRGQLRHRHALAEVAIAVGARADPGHQGAPRRNAHGTLRVGVGEANPACGQRIERRGLDRRMAGAAEQRGGPVVGGNEQHVGTLCHEPILPSLQYCRQR